MSDTQDNGVVAELKRRKVVRAALVYGAGAFAVLQIADIVVEPLGLPSWSMRVLIWTLILGLPVALAVSWFVDLARGDEGPARWVSLPAAGAVVLLLLVGIMAGWLLRPGTPTTLPTVETQLDANVVAVLPFSVLGSDELSYLSDAVARLLSTSLDGTAGLRAVTSHSLMGYIQRRVSTSLTDDIAREAAAHFGAGIWVMGDVVEAGDQLRIEGTLFVASSPNAKPVSASVTGTVDELFASVDELAARLVAEREAGSGPAQKRIAALTTSSPKAMRAYIEGERAFRSGSYLPAIQSFTDAVETDASFALAFYRLSMTQERLAWAEASRQSAEAAYEQSLRLSQRDRQFLESIVALRRGNTSHAEQMLLAYARAYPDDAEAWYQLGEILFHGEPLRGGSITAAREPLEKALFYDPGDLGALYHLVRIAIKQGDSERMNSLTTRFIELSPTGERTLELRALEASSRADTEAFASVLTEMRGSPDTFLPIAVWSVATFGQNPVGAESIAHLMTGADRPRDVRGAGYVQLAYLALSQGRQTEAMAALEQAQELGDPDAIESYAWLTMLPFVRKDAVQIQSALNRLATVQSSPVAESSRPSSFFSAHNGVHDIVRLYLRGLMTAGEGNAVIDEIVLKLSTTKGTAGTQVLAEQLATGISAQGMLAAGDADGALALLEGLEIEGWYELTFVSPYYAGALERFTLAELLLKAGRENEALGWYAGLGENTVAELAFTGPALLRQAGIHQRAGRTGLAQRLQGRFEELWEGADPKLRDAVKAQYGSRE